MSFKEFNFFYSNQNKELHEKYRNFKMDFELLAIKKSSEILEKTVQINIFSTIPTIFIGLFGHSLTIFLYSKKRYRLNSSCVYLLCLAIIDSSFLIVHL